MQINLDLLRSFWASAPNSELLPSCHSRHEKINKKSVDFLPFIFLFCRYLKGDDAPPFRLLLSFSIKKERPGLERIPNPVSVECPFVTLPVYVEPFSRHNPFAIGALYGVNPVVVTTIWT